ncbi:M16 family metallopeptidase [Fibrella aquatica]|uniref:M16 family metallopeptidase n=1 Tax=Fibrella aquatica TaxID=3242487 RepID=UPI00352259A7
MSLDRTIAPDYHPVQDIRLAHVDSQLLSNGAPLYIVAFDQQPVMRVEVNFDAGAWYETQPATSSFAWKMLAEGTTSRTSAQISDAFDRYGAFLELNSGFDRGSLVVYCQPKHLANVLPLVAELLTEATYPEKEFEDLRTITLQNLKVSYEKTSHLASVRFRQKLYGQQHPYGRSQHPDTVGALPRSEAVAFYNQHIRQQPFRVLLAGQITLTETALVNEILGQLPIVGQAKPGSLITPPTFATDASPELIDRPNSLQSTIRLGRVLFKRDHPDFYKMLVTNEILGGYFGSRLMKNIREDKGFTYGISSNVGAFRQAGQFLIGTDVKREFTQQTIDEIWKEINRLHTEPTPADELLTVQNYMAGEFVGSLNTPFEIADRYKLILLDGLPVDFLSGYISRIRAVTAEDVQQMAQTYLTEQSLVEVVAGGK